jgi:hypothetical protein
MPVLERRYRPVPPAAAASTSAAPAALAQRRLLRGLPRLLLASCIKSQPANESAVLMLLQAIDFFQRNICFRLFSCNENIVPNVICE